jgi:hypothetical protein
MDLAEPCIQFTQQDEQPKICSKAKAKRTSLLSDSFSLGLGCKNLQVHGKEQYRVA